MTYTKYTIVIQTVNKFVYEVRLHALVSLVYKFGRVCIRQMKVFVYVSVCAYTNIAYDVYQIYHCHNIQTVNEFVYGRLQVRLHALVRLVYKFVFVCLRQIKVFVYVSVCAYTNISDYVYKFGPVCTRDMQVFVYVCVRAYTNFLYHAYKINDCHIQTYTPTF